MMNTNLIVPFLLLISVFCLNKLCFAANSEVHDAKQANITKNTLFCGSKLCEKSSEICCESSYGSSSPSYCCDASGHYIVVKVVGAAVGAFFLVIIGAAVVKWLDETCNTRAREDQVKDEPPPFHIALTMKLKSKPVPPPNYYDVTGVQKFDDKYPPQYQEV